MHTLLRRLPGFGPPPPQVAVIPLFGVISGARLRRGLNLHAIAKPLERAFSLKNVKAVALQINSPGGSPVQSRLIHDRIRALAEEKDVPVFAFAEDAAASGGYILALAGDEIYADASSIIGSIGVISAGFGFQQMIEKIGVERRSHTAGDRKDALDPFQPAEAQDVARLQDTLSDLHTVFIDLVRARRGARLQESAEDLFSGAYWTGGRAQTLGLIDGVADMRAFFRARFGSDVELKTVAIDGRPPWARVLGNADAGGAPLGQAAAVKDALEETPEAVLSALEARLLWSRLGL